MADSDHKTCSKCRLCKPRSEFRKDKQKPDGFYSSCRDCCKAKERERWATDPDFRAWHNSYRYRNPEAVKRSEIRQRTENRERLLERKREHRLRHLEKERERSREYGRENRASVYEQQSAWREANRDKVNAHCREWRRKNPERSKAILAASRHKRRLACSGATVTGPELAEWMKRAPKHCYWCECKLTIRTMSIDHYVPLSKGGAHALSNLVPSCLSCNKKKNAKDPLKFARQVGRLL